MSADQLLTVAARIRACHDEKPVGALAIVGTNEQIETVAPLLGALAAADRPTKLFDGLRAANGWLKRQAEEEVPPGPAVRAAMLLNGIAVSGGE